MRRQCLADSALLEHAFPSEKCRHLGPSLMRTFLIAFQPGLIGEQRLSITGTDCLLLGCDPGKSIIREKNNQRILVQIPFSKASHQAPDIFIDILNHTVKARTTLIETELFKFKSIFCRGDIRPMRRIGRNISKKWVFLVLLDPPQGLRKEDIRAETFRFHKGAIMTDDWIHIFVSGHVLRLTNAAIAMHKYFIESACTGLVFLLQSQMPLTKYPRSVAGLLQVLRQGHRRERQPCAGSTSVGHTILKRHIPSQQRRAGRRTGRAHMKVRKRDALLVKGIDVRGFEPRVPLAAQLSVALVICHDQDDVGLARSLSRHAHQ